MSENNIFTAEQLPWLQPSLDWLQHCIAGDRLPHAILVSGVSGVGKRIFANEISKQLLVDRVAAEKQQQALAQWQAGTHPDFHPVELADGKKDISIEQIRDLIADVQLTSYYGGYRIATIFPAERMSISATNSLLKCLEEPPKNTVIILITERLSQIKATIRSRCQIVNVNAPDSASAKNWLEQQNINATNTDALLQYHNNAPLAVIKAKNDGQNQLESWWNSLSLLLKQQKSPLAVASELAGESDLKPWFKWCQLVTHDAMLIANGLNKQVKDAQVITDLELFIKTIPVQRLFDYNQHLQQLTRMVETTVNKQMLLEAALIPWSIELRIEQPSRLVINN